MIDSPDLIATPPREPREEIGSVASPVDLPRRRARFGSLFVPLLACGLAFGAGGRRVEAAPPPVLPPCPTPAGTGDRDTVANAGFGFRWIFAGDCAPRWTVDFFRPAFDATASDPFRFSEAPYVDGAALTAVPASLAYGDGADQTVVLTFEALHLFRAPHGTSDLGGFSEALPMIYWAPGYSRSLPGLQWARRRRDASGVFQPWERMEGAAKTPPFTLTPTTICGGHVAGSTIQFDLPPTSCPFTLHWTGPVTEDQQVVYPVSYYAIDTDNRSSIWAQGFTWVPFSIAGTPELSAALTPNPSEVTIGEQFHLVMTIKNTLDAALSMVQPDGPLTVSGDGEATQLTGPEPASVASLAPGASADFTWTFETKKQGAVVLKARVQAHTAGGDTVSVDAKCGLGAPTSSLARAAEAPPTCPIGGGAQVEIVPCKLALREISGPIKVPRLGGDSTPAPGGGYPPGGT